MLIVLLGLGTLEVYHVMALEALLDDTTRAADLMDGKFKRAQYEKAKFDAVAEDLLSLAPKDPNAEQIVAHFKLRQLHPADSALAVQRSQSGLALTNAAPALPAAASNSAPFAPSQATNNVPIQSPAAPAN